MRFIFFIQGGRAVVGRLGGNFFFVFGLSLFELEDPP